MRIAETRCDSGRCVSWRRKLAFILPRLRVPNGPNIRLGPGGRIPRSGRSEVSRLKEMGLFARQQGSNDV